MSNPTSNYNFQMPTNTDLVTDLPADFEVFGQAVDTQMKTNADAATQKATLTTKGDIYAATGGSTPARLAVGANDTVLTADSTAATGMKWAAPAGGGGMTLLSTTTLTGATNFSVTSISGSYENLYILIAGAITGSESNKYRLSVQNTSSENNSITRFGNASGSMNLGEALQLDSDEIVTKSTSLPNSYAITIFGYSKTTGYKPVMFTSAWGNGTTKRLGMGAGSYTSTSAITSINFSNWAGDNFTGGTMYVYGVK
jgi:hypothetical protein